MTAESRDLTFGGPAIPWGEGGPVRVRFDLAYDGTDFAGWASQPGQRTVQAAFETALSTVLRQPGVRVTVAGRTDAGVHARAQVCHADLPALPALSSPALSSGPVRSAAPVARLQRRLNGVLPADVRVLRVEPAPPGFDARFSALSRQYEYRLVDGVPDPLRRRDTVAWPRRLDAAAMHTAAQPLLGEHDFAAFCRRRAGATTVRGLLRLDVSRRLERAGGSPASASRGDLVTIAVAADAFCHSMVRALVGALVAVGEGRRPVGWPAQVLAGRQRDPGVRVMPAHGLALVAVSYPPDRDLAARAEQTRRLRADPADRTSPGGRSRCW